MKLWRVADVMTREVVSVSEDTPYRDLVDLLIRRRVSAVPVVDRHERVTGVVSEADLLHKVEAAGPVSPRIFDAWRRRGDRAKAGGRTAAEVMTSPVVSAEASLALAAAARRMQREQVKRLPVVDHEGHLIGIVARSDLLKVHLRSDSEICRDVMDEALPDASRSNGSIVRVTCADGVVTLFGRVPFRSMAERIAGLARRVPGVVDLADGLTFDIDDSMINGSDRGTPFGVA
jgi:CBS-domain-containing membrane protein